MGDTMPENNEPQMSDEEYEAYLAQFRENAAGLLGNLHPADRTRVVRHDRFDNANFASVHDAPESTLARQVQAVGAEYDYATDFFGDLFCLMVKASPTLYEAAEMDPTRRPNHVLVTAFNDYDELQGLRDFTVGDPGATGTAIMSMDTEIWAAFEAMEQARAMAEAQAAMNAAAGEQAQQAIDGLESGALTPERAQEMLDAAQAAADAAPTDQQIENAMPSGKALAKAAEQARKDLEEEQELFSTFGLGPGELKRMSFSERRRLAERLKRNRMASFAKLIGQFKRLADANVRRRVTDQPDEIVSVELSDRIADLTPMEMLAMDEPGLSVDFDRRLLQQGLVTYRKEGVERVGLGPQIVICDESSSMGEAFGGCTKEAWSKAVALALADVCRRERRDFWYVGFAGNIWGGNPQVWSVNLMPGRPDYLQQVITFTEHFYSGGTDFNPALLLAMEISSRYDDRKRPDFVLLTDGDGSLRPDVLKQWNEHRASTGARSWAVGIGDDVSYSTLQLLGDDVRSVLSLTDSKDHLIDLFQQL